MPDGLIPALLICAAVIVWSLTKVYKYARKSAQQWQATDKSKLKKWDDEEEW